MGDYDVIMLESNANETEYRSCKLDFTEFSSPTILSKRNRSLSLYCDSGSTGKDGIRNNVSIVANEVIMLEGDVNEKEDRSRKLDFTDFSSPTILSKRSRSLSYDCDSGSQGKDDIHNEVLIVANEVLWPPQPPCPRQLPKEDQDIMLKHYGAPRLLNYPKTVQDYLRSKYDLGTLRAARLGEIFEVRTEDDRLNGCFIYGNITITDDMRNAPFKIYSRSHENKEIIRRGHPLQLNNPSRSSIIFKGMTIDVNLVAVDLEGRHCEYKKKIELIQKTEPPNQLLQQQVDGMHGPLFVSYALFNVALQASIEIRLLPTSHHSAKDVYGSITASYKVNRLYTNAKPVRLESGGIHYPVPEQNFSVKLFEKAKEDVIGAVEEDSCIIPLSRSIIAVPAVSLVNIEANLKFGDDHASIEGKTEILPRCLGGWYWLQSIRSEYGEIRIKVTWRTRTVREVREFIRG